MGQSYPMLLDLGARQAEGGFDVLQLIGGASYMQHMKIPEDMGPVRFQSSKLQRKELPGRGKGIVAQADIGVGELLIAARPIELVRPGDGDWHFQADLEEVLTQRLLQRCMDCDAQCVEDVFSLFDGEGSERPKWNPHAWRSNDLALPMPIGAGNLELYRRLRGAELRFNEPNAMAFNQPRCQRGGRQKSRYNRSINSCAKASQWIAALHLAREMLTADISPTIITFNSLLNASARAGQRLDSVRAFSISNPRYFIAMALLDTIVALQVLPDVISYSSAIRACEENSLWLEAVGLLHTMDQAQITPNGISYNSVISVCQGCGLWMIALDILRSMEIRSILPDIFSYNSAISCCKSSGRWQQALSLYSCLPSASLQPDLYTWNSLLSSCESDQWRVALRVFDAMLSVDMVPDNISYNSIIAALAAEGHWTLALEFLSGVTKPSLGMVSNSILAACEAQEWPAAVQLLMDMPGLNLSADECCFSSAINSCRRSTCWQIALSLLQSMAVHLRSDSVCYNCAIACCHWQWAYALLGRALGDGVADRLGFHSVINACRGEWRSALELFTAMKRWNIRRDEVSYNSSISTCEKGGQWIHSLTLLLSMNVSRVAPGCISCSGAISAGARRARWRRALGLLRFATLRRMEHDVISVNGAISAGSPQIALSLLRQMESQAMRPSGVSCNGAISAWEGSHWMMVLQLLSSQLQRDVVSFNSSISACQKARHQEEALKLQVQMEEEALSPNVVTFNASMACDWRQALEHLDALQSKDLEPDLISLNCAMVPMRSAWPVALSLLAHANAMQPQDLSFNCALGCLPSYAWLSAVGLLGSMGRMVLQPNELTLTGVVNACEVRLLLLFFPTEGG
ncbi:unnamed protein product [Effrenium voratum]|nr:unnamed protein product [Effrenium voratum]